MGEKMKKLVSVIAILAGISLCAYVGIRNNTITEIKDEIVAATNIDTGFNHSSWKNSHTKVRGIYVTGPTAGTERIDEIIQLINDTELNAIVLDVKDDNGNITFKMDNPDVIATGACVPYIGDINALMQKLKANDIYVIARIPCFKDPTLATVRPDLALYTDTGEPVTDAWENPWVNPCKEEVWDYNISIATTCCDLGFDEIQFDYVRFPVTANSDAAIYGAEVNDDNRQEYIEAFLSKACSELHAKDMPVTADVFGTIIKSEVDAVHVGQDYKSLASSLDALCPMIYPSHYAAGEFGLDVPDAAPYETIYAALNGSTNLLSNVDNKECAVIRPWLQAFSATWVEGYIEYDGTAIRKQIQAVYDAGYDEWILWNSKSNYSADGLEH